MKIIVPDYYENFQCIANNCGHNCCIGWEIDIDDETLEYYQNTKGKFNKDLKKGIEINDGCACFKLDGKGRCIFLNENNLCDIILNLGDDALCQICADHPRFRNFFSDRIEIGLGLCCEEAGRIILNQKEKFKLIILSTDEGNEQLTPEEKETLDLRKQLFDLIQNNEISLEEKIDQIIKKSGYTFPNIAINEWAEIFLSLERLDDGWTNILKELKQYDSKDISLPTEFNRLFENLLIYFVFRHVNEKDYSKLLFVVLSCLMIKAICKFHYKKYGYINSEDIIEYSRMYSSEIEYSDENIEIILEILKR